MSVDINEIQEADDFLPLILKREIYTKFFNTEDNWKLSQYRTYEKYGTDYENWKKYHPIIENETFIKQADSDKDLKLFDNVKHFTEKQFNVSINKILRVRFVYAPPNENAKNDSYGFPHVDMYEPHYTLLYYVNDNDAETIFFDQKFTSHDDVDYTNKNIIKKIIPKEGKAVFFNGLIYHSGNVSQIKSRLTLNINFTLK